MDEPRRGDTVLSHTLQPQVSVRDLLSLPLCKSEICNLKFAIPNQCHPEPTSVGEGPASCAKSGSLDRPEATPVGYHLKAVEGESTFREGNVRRVSQSAM